jgi:hypothetical protein
MVMRPTRVARGGEKRLNLCDAEILQLLRAVLIPDEAQEIGGDRGVVAGCACGQSTDPMKVSSIRLNQLL